MKKLLCIALCLLLLTGCHGQILQPGETVQELDTYKPYDLPDTFDTSRHFEITFWAKNDTNLTQVGIYKDAIAAFEELYPNITVNLRLYTDYGKIYNDVITNIATDTTPNVCITYPDHIATYLTGADTVVPLDDLFDDPAYGLGGSELRFDGPTREEIIPQFLAEGSFGGNHYAIPFMRSTEACYVNKTYVEQLGFELPEVLTWDFVWEVSEAATARDAQGNYLINGQKVMIPFLYKSTDNMMIQMLRQKGLPYSTAAGEIGLFSDETADLLLTIAEHVESGAFSTFKLNGYPANFLNAGQCIFAIDSTAGATWMGSDAPLIDIAEDKLVQFETEVMMIPQFDPENPQMISQGPSMCVFQKDDPQEVLASWLFAQFLLTDAVQIAYASTEGYVPVTSQAQQSEEYQDYLSRAGEDNDLYYSVKMDATRLLLDNVDNTFVTPVFNGSASLRNAAGQLIENVTKGVRRGERVNRSFVRGQFNEVTSLYRLDQIVNQSGEKTFGAMPPASIALLSSLGVCWLCMGAYVLREHLKKKKAQAH